MSDFERKKLFWLRLGSLAAVGIFLIALFAGGLLYRESRRMNALMAQAGAVLDTVEDLADDLEEVDWSALADTVGQVNSAMESADLPNIVEQLNGVSAALSAANWEDIAQELEEMSTSARASMERVQARLDEALAAVESFLSRFG